MATPIIRYRLAGIIKDREFSRLPFGQQIDVRRKLREFRERAKVAHVSQKRRTFASALREAIELYNADEYLVEVHDAPSYRDDVFEFFYTTKPQGDTTPCTTQPAEATD